MLDLPEKAWFALSFWPPIALTCLILRLLHIDPRPLMNSIAFLIPGYLGHTYDESNGTLRLRLDGGADYWTEQLAKVQEQLGLGDSGNPSRPPTPQATRRQPADDPAASLGDLPGPARANATAEGAAAEGLCGGGDGVVRGDSEGKLSAGSRGAKKVADLYVNTKHLMWTSLIPVFFLNTYFWDQAILKRDVSFHFPLDNCMSPDLTFCFWNDKEYSMFKYPDYHKLDCQEMWKRTVSSEATFAFKAPPSAKFYKCYEVRLAFVDVLAAMGDITALFLLNGLFVLRYSIAFTSMKLDVEGQRDALEALSAEKQRVRIWMVVWVVAFWLTLPLVQMSYGVYTNSYVVIYMVPLMPVFCIILLWNHLEVLQEQTRTVQEEHEHSLEEESSGGSGSSSGSLSRRRCEAEPEIWVREAV